MRQRFTTSLLFMALGAGLLIAEAPGAHADGRHRARHRMQNTDGGFTFPGGYDGGGGQPQYGTGQSQYGTGQSQYGGGGGKSPYAGWGGKSPQYGGGQSQYGGGGGKSPYAGWGKAPQYGGGKSQYGGSPSQWNYPSDQGMGSSSGSQPYETSTSRRRHGWQRNGPGGYSSGTGYSRPSGGSRGNRFGWRGRQVPPGH
jgi:hypothetical protein